MVRSGLFSGALAGAASSCYLQSELDYIRTGSLELLFHNLLLIPGTPGEVAETYIIVQRWSLALGRKVDPGQGDHPDCEQL